MNIKNKQFKTFDPNPSLKYALQLLEEANISKFSLIGKLAMWVHLEDESQHQYTKDVDFAILLNDCNKLEKVVSKKGIPFKYLQIGGIGIREEFVELLEESSETWNIRVAAYCLMPNHYHILVQTPDANISRSMRHINGVYTQRFNKRHRYDGQQVPFEFFQ